MIKENHLMVDETKITDKSPEMPYLTQEKKREIEEGMAIMGIPHNAPYPGAEEFCRSFKKVGLLQFEGLRFGASTTTALLGK